MDSFTSLGLREAYRKVEQLGDRLSEIAKLIDWEEFRPPHLRICIITKQRKEDGLISMLF